jgi:hypothetical protein
MRRLEQGEIDSGAPQTGALYDPKFAKAYEKGFRVVGRLHSDSRNSTLTEAQRRDADRVFGSVLARVDARCDD